MEYENQPVIVPPKPYRDFSFRRTELVVIIDAEGDYFVLERERRGRFQRFRDRLRLLL